MKSLSDKLDDVRAETLEYLKASEPDGYDGFVKYVANLHGDMDPERITRIDHGEYQGTVVFVVGAKGYQPDRHWYVKVGYGSCSGCDAFQHARGSQNEAEEFYAIMHDIASGFREMNTGDAVA